MPRHVILVLIAIASVQFGAAIAKSMFDWAHPVTLAFLRAAIGALLFLAFARPTLKGRTGRPFRLVLAGEGPLRAELEQKTQQLGLSDAVTFLGFRSDMANLYHGADLTLCPSESETLSLLLLESLACGTPALATNVGGIPDILSAQHDCGAMVPYGDIAALTDAMAGIMEDEDTLKRWSANAPRVIEEKFSVRSQCREILALYRGEGAEG